MPWPKTRTSFPVHTASLSMNELVGPGGLSRRHAFRAGSYAAATAMRWNVDPAGPCLLERPKRIICLPVQTLATPPSFGTIGAFEADPVDLVELERLERDVERDRALVAHLGDVADTAQDPVRDARRTAGPGGDLVGRLGRDL